MYLHEIYEILNLSKSNYNKWAVGILEDYEEGRDYILTRNKYGKKLFDLKDYVSVHICYKYNLIDKMLNILKYTEDPLLQKLYNNTSNLEWLTIQLNRYTRRFKDIPKGYVMPSEVDISKKSLVALGYINEEYDILELGKKCLLPRVIVGAREYNIHVIIDKKYIDLIKKATKELP